MNKTVIKKHTAMSTVLFKKFTAFVTGVILLLVLGAEYAAAQNNDPQNPMSQWRFGFTPKGPFEWSNIALDQATIQTLNYAGADWLWVVDKYNQPLTQGVDYEVFITDNKEPGDAKVVLKGRGTYQYIRTGPYDTKEDWYIEGNSSGDLNHGTFTIEKRDITSGVTIINNPDNKDIYYTGNNIDENTLGLKLQYNNGSSTYELQKGDDKDYTITFSDNKNVGRATITITGTGDRFKGTKTLEFNIVQVPLDDATLVTVLPESFPTTAYTGCEVNKALSLTYKTYNGMSLALVAGTDYTVSYTNTNSSLSNAPINVGTYNVTATGINNFTSSVTKPFEITKRNINDSKIQFTIPDGVYTGSEVKPTISAVLSGTGCSTPYKLVEGVDFEVDYTGVDLISSGEKSLTIKGMGNFYGETSKTYIIGAKCLSGSNGTTITLSQDNFKYDGTAHKPTVTVKVNGTDVSPDDYTVSYIDNVDAGNGWVVVTGKNNYSTSCSMSVPITIEQRTVKIVPNAYSKVYNNDANNDGVTWGKNNSLYTITGDGLIGQDQDKLKIDIQRETGEDVKEYNLIVTKTADPNYSVSVDQNVKFTIKGKCIDGAGITVTPGTGIGGSYIWTGNEIKPDVTVTLDGQLLDGSNDKDYRVVYKNNVNVGTATIEIYGAGNYANTGTNCLVTTTFKITSSTPTITLTQSADRCNNTAQVTASFSGAGEYEWKWIVTGADPVSGYATQGTDNFSSGQSSAKVMEVEKMAPGGATVQFTVKYNTNQEASQTLNIVNYHIDDYPSHTETICENNELQLNATIPNSASYKGKWTIQGTGQVDDDADPATWIRNVKQGASTTATWTISRLDASGTEKCKSKEEWNLTNNTITISGSADKIVCDADASDISTSVKPESGLTGSWIVVGSTGAEITSSTLDAYAKANVSKLAVGKNTFKLTLTAPGCTNPVTKDFNIYRTYVSAKADKAYVCSDTDPVKITGNDPSELPNGSGHWEYDTHSARVDNVNAYETNAYVYGTGGVQFTWVVDSYIVDQNGQKKSCKQSATTPMVYNKQVTASASTDYCVADDVTTKEIQVTSSSLVGVKGEWTVEPGSTATVSPKDNSKTTVSNLPFGETTLTWTIKAENTNCPAATANVKIVRLTSAFSVTPTAVCKENSEVELKAQATNVQTGKWSFTGGNGSFVGGDDYSPNTKVKNLAESGSGVNTVRWEIQYITKAGVKCVSFHDEKIYMLKVKANAGNKQNVCEPTAKLGAAAITATTPITEGFWTPPSNDIHIDNSTDPSTTVSNLNPGDNTFKWTVQRKSPDGTQVCTDEAYVTITYNKVTTAQVAPDIYACDNDLPVTLTGNYPSGDGTGSWKCIVGNASFVNGIQNQDQVQVFGLAEGENQFQWSIKRGQCSSEAVQKVYYVPVRASAGADQYLCVNSANLQAQDNSSLHQKLQKLGVVWEKGWSSSVNDVSFQNTASEMTGVWNLTKGKNTFTWSVKATLPDGRVCQNSSDVVYYNDAVGDVYAGEDIVTCGIEDPRSTTNKHMYLGNVKLNGQELGDHQTGEWTCITTSSVIFDNKNSHSTEVTGLQRYAQQTQPGYWANYNMANVFVWSITYENPDPNINHKCTNSDTVQVIWLAPYNANAGGEVYSCAHDVNLHAKDEGAGAMSNWWVPTPSTNTPIEYSNQLWGGTETLSNVPAPYTVTRTVQNDGFDASKAETYLYEGSVTIDGHLYYTRYVRTVYKDDNRVITKVEEAYSYKEGTQTLISDPITSFTPGAGNTGTNITEQYAYQDDYTPGRPSNNGETFLNADKQYNVHLDKLQTTSDATDGKLSGTTFRWYKNNQLNWKYQGQNRLVSCTVWDDVTVYNLGMQVDISAGTETAICADTAKLAAVANVTPMNNQGQYEIVDGSLHAYWEVIHGSGKFITYDSDNKIQNGSTLTNAIVKNMAYDTNVYRWNVRYTVKVQNTNSSTGQKDWIDVSCSSSDDVYITNTLPSASKLPEDIEVCSDETTLATNIPVRYTRSEWYNEQEYW